MSSRDFTDPTSYKIEKIEIDGNDVIGMFISVSIYENIYIPAVTGTMILVDTDGNGLIEDYELEFTEKIELEFKNALDEQMKFSGYLNGLKNEYVKDSKRFYAVDFASEFARKNETTFVTQRFKEATPQDIVQEILDKKLEAKESEIFGSGIPMNYLGSRKKPFDIIRYVLTHGVTENSTYNKSGDLDQEETSKGTTGFLCWETLKGYRFASVDQIIKGEGGEQQPEFSKQLQNRNLDMETAMKGVIDYKFPKIGNLQNKLRSGALNNTSIIMDMDAGVYKEVNYFDEANLTEKEKEIASKFPTRYMWKPIANEKFNNECEKAQPDTGDQTKRFLSQNVGRQNTFDDQFGEFTLAPHFNMNAGDTIEFKLGKVQSEKEGGYDKKHSGRYVIKSLAHHITFDGRAYTKIATIRSNKQQDDSTSAQ